MENEEWYLINGVLVNIMSEEWVLINGIWRLI